MVSFCVPYVIVSPSHISYDIVSPSHVSYIISPSHVKLFDEIDAGFYAEFSVLL